MKIQAILFSLLQTRAVLSIDRSQSQASLVADCSLPCKQTSLRLSSSKMEECLALNCGGRDTEAQTVIGAEISEDLSACLHTCDILRFGAQKKEICVKRCDTKYDPSGGRSTKPNDGGRSPKQDKSAKLVSEDLSSCLHTCSRLRFGAQKKKICVGKCNKKYDPSGGWSTKPNGGGRSPKRDKGAKLVSEDLSTCLRTCSRLRFGAQKKKICVGKCNRKYGSSGGRYIKPNGGERSPKSDNDTKDCKAVCDKLRFSRDSQVTCVEDCKSFGSIIKDKYEEKDEEIGPDEIHAMAS